MVLLARDCATTEIAGLVLGDSFRATVPVHHLSEFLLYHALSDAVRAAS